MAVKRKSSRITGKQRAARKRNIAVARAAKKKNTLRTKPWKKSKTILTKKGKQSIMGGQNKTNKWLRLKGGGWHKNY